MDNERRWTALGDKRIPRGSALFVAQVLADMADARGKILFHHSDVAAATGLNADDVVQALRKLELAGVIEEIPKPPMFGPEWHVFYRMPCVAGL